MAPYQYEPLSHGKRIRILEIDPSPVASDPLKGSFHEHNLSQAPSFEALSYVWAQSVSDPRLFDGPPIFYVGQDHITIGENLASALRRLRLPESSRFVWADALCIHQSDIPEKNHQVEMMADVYRKASRTVAWFGEGNEDSESALRKLSVIAASATDYGYPPFETTNKISMYQLSSERDLRAFVGNPYDVLRMAKDADLSRVYSAEWFTRLWIVQEAVLSSNLVVYLGREEVDWKVLEDAISLMHRAVVKAQEQIPDFEELNRVIDLFIERKNQFLYRRPGNLETSLDSLFGHTASTIQDFAMFNFVPDRGQFPLIVTRDRPVKFLDTLWDLRYRECGNERDRVYAALSFIPWDLPIKIGVDFTVDYTKTEVEVYTAFTRALLRAHVMKVLLFAGIWDRKYQLPIDNPGSFIRDTDQAPSWVCEFRLSKLRRGKYQPWHNPIYDQDDDMDIEEMESPDIEYTTSLYERRLRVGLRILDNVEEVVPSLDKKTLDSTMMYRGLYSRLKAFTRARNLTIQVSLDRAELTRFAEVLGLDYKNVPGLLAKLTELLEYGRQIEQQIAVMNAIVSGTVSKSFEPEYDLSNSLLPSDHADPATDRVKHELSLMARRLTFTALFSTSQGWIGTGPDTIKPGDVLVRVSGLLRTCILRKVEGTEYYMLVGGCFLRDDLGVDEMGNYIMASLI